MDHKLELLFHLGLIKIFKAILRKWEYCIFLRSAEKLTIFNNQTLFVPYYQYETTKTILNKSVQKLSCRDIKTFLKNAFINFLLINLKSPKINIPMKSEIVYLASLYVYAINYNNLCRKL